MTSLDVAADGSMLVWTTPEFVFFTCLERGHWEKGKCEKPPVLQLTVRPEDREKLALVPHGDGEAPMWTPVKFDAATHKDEDGLYEREIIAYSGAAQVRPGRGAVRWGRDAVRWGHRSEGRAEGRAEGWERGCIARGGPCERTRAAPQPPCTLFATLLLLAHAAPASCGRCGGTCGTRARGGRGSGLRAARRRSKVSSRQLAGARATPASARTTASPLVHAAHAR